jgi:hypothetical protein
LRSTQTLQYKKVVIPSTINQSSSGRGGISTVLEQYTHTSGLSKSLPEPEIGLNSQTLQRRLTYGRNGLKTSTQARVPNRQEVLEKAQGDNRSDAPKRTASIIRMSLRKEE